MKPKLYEKFGFLSDKISVSKYISLTGKNTILPYYHSVTSDPKPHLKYLKYFRKTEDFRTDLGFFQKNYQSIPIDKLSITSAFSSYHITFDDGLSEIYNNVIPLLFDQKIHATFFINSDFVDNKKMFFRHKISIILDELLNSEEAKSKAAHFFSTSESQILTKVDGLKNEPEINELATLLKINFEDYLQELKPYLSSKQIIEIQKMGFIIGNHSKNHPDFENISFAEQQYQVQETNRFLKKQFQIQQLYFSFPFGDQNIKNNFFDWMYHNEGIAFSFGVSGIKNDGYKQHLHRIPMEYGEYSASQIIKFEYFYYLLKAFLGKNKIIR